MVKGPFLAGVTFLSVSLPVSGLGGWAGRPKVEMCSFAQATCLRVIQTLGSVRGGSERCPPPRRAQLGRLHGSERVSTLGRTGGGESQQMPLPRGKYRAFVPGPLAPCADHSDPLPGIRSEGEGKRAGRAGSGWPWCPVRGELVSGAAPECGTPTPHSGSKSKPRWYGVQRLVSWGLSLMKRVQNSESKVKCPVTA